MDRKSGWLVALGAFIVPLALLLLGPTVSRLAVRPLLGASSVARNALVFYELFLVGPLFGLAAGLTLRPGEIVAAGAGTTVGYALDFRYVPFSLTGLVAMTLITLAGFAVGAAVAYGVRMLVRSAPREAHQSTDPG